MSVLNWTADLDVNVAFMDHDHVEAAALINGMAAAAGPERAALLGKFITHCREHFARENAMMTEVGFFAQHCHVGEHERVLEELETVRAKVEAGEAMDEYFQSGLPEWLMNHRNTMDFVTADFACRAGYKG